MGFQLSAAGFSHLHSHAHPPLQHKQAGAQQQQPRGQQQRHRQEPPRQQRAQHQPQQRSHASSTSLSSMATVGLPARTSAPVISPSRAPRTALASPVFESPPPTRRGRTLLSLRLAAPSPVRAHLNPNQSRGSSLSAAASSAAAASSSSSSSTLNFGSNLSFFTDAHEDLDHDNHDSYDHNTYDHPMNHPHLSTPAHNERLRLSNASHASTHSTLSATACVVCGSDHSPESQLLCDHCDQPHHVRVCIVSLVPVWETNQAQARERREDRHSTPILCFVISHGQPAFKNAIWCWLMLSLFTYGTCAPRVCAV